MGKKGSGSPRLVDHPDEPCHGVFRRVGHSAPPPGPPAQAIPLLERALALCQAADVRNFVTDRCGLVRRSLCLVRARRGRLSLLEQAISACSETVTAALPSAW